MKIHRNEIMESNDVSASHSIASEADDASQTSDTPNNSHLREGEKFNCENCGDQYHNRVLFNEHAEQCQSGENEQKSAMSYLTKLFCPICKNKYKQKTYLRKHLGRSSCGVSLKKILGNDDGYLPEEINYSPAYKVQCSNCDTRFRTHASMVKHFFKCLLDKGIVNIRCITCDVGFSTKNNFYRHMKRFHISENLSFKKGIKRKYSLADKTNVESKEATTGALQCNKCNKSFDTQIQLVMHLAAHMANIDEDPKVPTKLRKTMKCVKCGKKFRYKAFLRKHLKVCHSSLPPDLSILDVPLKANQCDLCGKNFKYAKSLTWHKNTKHPTIDDSLVHKRAIEFSKCPAKCLHCDMEFANEHHTKMHNRMHIENNVKVKNEYSCPECDIKFTNTKFFRLHIKDHNDQWNCDEDNDDVYDASISNYCEVTSNVVDEDNDVKPCIDLAPQPSPVVELNGITCAVCGKKLESLRGYNLHMRTHSKVNQKKNVDMSCFVCKEVCIISLSLLYQEFTCVS